MLLSVLPVGQVLQPALSHPSRDAFAVNASRPGQSSPSSRAPLVWQCPSESQVLATAPEHRWEEWASAEPGCCALPADGVSCGPDIGPCCVKQVQAPAAAADHLRLLLPRGDLSSIYCDGVTSADNNAPCVIKEAEADSMHVVAHASTCSNRQCRMSVAAAIIAALEGKGGGAGSILKGARKAKSGNASNASNARELRSSIRRGSASAPVIFVHVSKAGGTSFCALARENLPNGSYPLKPNMWRTGDGPMWCRTTVAPAKMVDELSCAKREEAFRAGEGNGPFKLMAIERYLDGGGALCPGFAYVGLFREPIPRLLSHLNHFFNSLRIKDRNVLRRDFFSRLVQTSSGHGTDCTGSAVLERLVNWSYVDRSRETELRRPDLAIYWGALCGIVDNYQTRTLLGTSLSPTPFGTLEPVDSEQTARAITTMLDFALVLVLEQALGHDERMQAQLGDVLGWEHTSMPEENTAASRPINLFQYDNLSPEELDILKAHNRGDEQIYGAALAMQSLVNYDEWLGSIGIPSRV